MEVKDFLIIGHPRGGTTYSSKLFKTFGFAVGHEVSETSGIASWCFASEQGWNFWTDKKRKNEYSFRWTFLNVRHPLSIINSTIQEHKGNKDSLNLAQKWGNFKITSTNEIEIAVERYLKWEEVLWSNNIDYWFRVEDQQKYVYDTLKFLNYNPYYHLGENKINEHTIPRNINTRKKQFTPITINNIPDQYKEAIKEKIHFYGYK